MDTVGIEIVDRVLTRYTGSEAKVVVDSDILTIADNAFAHNEHIESIEVKSLSLRTVGKEAFSGCKRLREAHFQAIKGGIGVSAFEGCPRLSSFVIPNGAMEIGSRAFCGCAAHFVLQIPASIDVIGDNIVECSATAKINGDRLVVTERDCSEIEVDDSDNRKVVKTFKNNDRLEYVISTEGLDEYYNGDPDDVKVFERLK